MKVVHVPFVTGDMPPADSIWLPIRPDEAERLLTAYNQSITRAWHTPTLRIYEQVGIGVFISFTRQATAAEMADLREYLHDHCA